jgi:hypothetical protein
MDDELTVNLGDIHIAGGSGTDYLDMSRYTTYTLPSTSSYSISTGSGLWANGSNGTSVTSMPYITTNNTSSGITVDGDAEFKGNIKVNGRDLTEWMATLEKRLAILVPDPKKLEKYEALKKAYNHYKMLEALCEADDEQK